MLGHLGIALKRDHVGGCGDDVGVGQEYDLEGHASDCRVQSEGVPKGGDAEQEGYARGGSPTGAPPCIAQRGYSDPPGLNMLTKDMLIEKSPYPQGLGTRPNLTM